MANRKAVEAGTCRWPALRGWALALSWALLLVLLGLLVVRDARLRERVQDVEARAGALEAIARRQRGQIAELRATATLAGEPADTVALVIELGGPEFPQVIVRAGLDTEHERRIVLLLPAQDRERLERVSAEWSGFTDEEKNRFVDVLTASVEAGIRRELPTLFVARQDIEKALRGALELAAGPADLPRHPASRQ
jgi:hypothetical protein